MYPAITDVVSRSVQYITIAGLIELAYHMFLALLCVLGTWRVTFWLIKIKQLIVSPLFATSRENTLFSVIVRSPLRTVWRLLVSRQTRLFKKSASETLHQGWKFFPFCLNYHDILVKSLGAYYTLGLGFSWVFSPNGGVYYTQLRFIFGKLNGN